MQKCIFCKIKPLPSKKPEHILLNAMGGRKTTKKIICDDCNSQFGETIDKTLAESADIIRNLMNFVNGDGKSPPVLKGFENNNVKYKLYPGGKPEQTNLGKALDFKTHKAGIDIAIKARNDEHLHQLFPHIQRKLKLSDIEIKQLIDDSNIQRVTQPAPSTHLQISIGGTESIRSMAKSCLVLWALHIGIDEINHKRYNLIKDFILGKGGDLLTSLTKTDTRSLSSEFDFEEKFGQNYNIIYISSNSKGRVLGYFQFYGIMAWQIELCKEGAPTDSSTGLASNPSAPSIWSDEIAQSHPIPFSWINSANNNDETATVKNKFLDLMKQHFKQAQNDELERLITNSFKDHGIGEGDLITEDCWNDITNRVTHFFMRLPHTIKIPPYKG